MSKTVRIKYEKKIDQKEELDLVFCIDRPQRRTPRTYKQSRRISAKGKTHWYDSIRHKKTWY